MPQDIIGMAGDKQVEKYSVLQVSDDGGTTWLDFSTLRDPDEVLIAVRMVKGRGGIYGHRTADYRIWQNNEVLYSFDPTKIEVNGIVFEPSDKLEVRRFDDEEDFAAGWWITRVICNIEDAKIAVERCSRLRMPDDRRHYRVLTNGGKIRLSQMTPNAFRLSGIIWQADPLKLSNIEDVATDRYDRYAARIMEMSVEWDEQVVPILDELNADQDLRDRIYSFTALSL